MDSSKYLSMLKSLDDNLASEDLVVFKFFCQDIVKTSRLDNVKNPLDLFDALESCGAMRADNLQLLTELLFEAQRIDLMAAIGCTEQELKILIEEKGHKLSSYRRMLHQLSEHMVSSDVKQLKHIMKSTKSIQRSRLEEASDAYSLFSLIERKQMISPTNVSRLLQFTKQMDEEAGLSQIVSSYIDKEGLQVVHTKEVSTQADSTSSIEKSPLEIPQYRIRADQEKGICLIVNNEMFTPASKQHGCREDLQSPRSGSSIDAEALKKVFTKLQFQVIIRENLTKNQLLQAMKEHAKLDHSTYGIFICCILSHGEAGKVFGADCLPIPIYSLLSQFKPKHCPSLEGKPKVFFVQACQGGRQEDESLDSIPFVDGALPSVGETATAGDLETDYAGKIYNVSNIPRQADYLLGLATVSGFVSYRSKSRGSWYIQALCDLLEKLYNTTDLLSIITEVNNRVTEKAQKSGSVMATQIPLPQYTLRKRIYLRTL